MAKLVKFLRNNPKKSIFFCALAAYTSSYISTTYKNELLRRKFCSSVKPLGDATVSPITQLHRLTVFLNPFARHGRLLKEFEKNVAPILQLSGLDIQMVYTDNDAELKDFVSVLDSSGTDGILIAGDDHLLQKAVSAMVQRNDFRNSRVWNLPVGVIPVGIWNTFAEACKKESIVEWCYNALTPVLRSVTRRHHILEVVAIPFNAPETDASSNALVDTDHSSNDDSSPSPTVSEPTRKTYSLLGLEWSVWRDVEHGGGSGSSSKRRSKPVDTNDHLGTLAPLSPLSPKSWYRHLGVLRRHAWFWLVSDTSHSPKSEVSCSSFLEKTQTAADQTPAKSRVRSKRAQLTFTAPCDGCSNCWQTRQQSAPTFDVAPDAGKSRSWFNRLFNLSAKPTPQPLVNAAVVVEDRSSVVNEECGRQHTLDLDDMTGITVALDGDRIRVDVYHTPANLLSYLRSTFSRLVRNRYDKSSSDGGMHSFYCSTLRLFPHTCENEFYWIDNDHFEACPIEVRVCRNAVNMYTPSN